jgi:hypothetical protein
MPDMPVTPPGSPMPPWDLDPPARPRRDRRWLKVAVGMGAAAVVAVGATALAQSATSPGGAKNSDATVTASSSSTTTTVPGRPHGFGGPGRGRGGFGAGGFGGAGAFVGPGLGAGLVHGEFTIKGPNGYETLSERTGTVSDVTDTSGSTWSLTVKSADGTSGTFTVDSGTSVNGGELGIGSVKAGDTVSVTAVVSGGTSTAKSVTDQTVLKANGGTWQPKLSTPGPVGGPASPGSSSSTQGTTAPV